LIFQISVTINLGLALLEAFFMMVILFSSFYLIYRLTPRNSRIATKVFGRSLVISCLISFGLIFVIKFLLQILESFSPIFRALYKDTFSFSIMIITFTPLYRACVEKLFKQVISKEFKIWNYLLLILYLILALMFLSIEISDILNIPLFIEPLDKLRPYMMLIFKPEENNDIFYLSFLTAYITLIFIFALIYLVNRTRMRGKNIPKPALKQAMIAGGFMSYFVWAFQFFIFGAYLGNLNNLGNFELDIRVQITIITGIYLISFFYFLKYKYLPIHAKREIQGVKIEKSGREHEEDEKELVLKVEDLKTYFYTEEGIVKAVEGVSFEIYKGEVLGLVGETGCGKSVTALSLQQLIPLPGVIEEGRVFYEGEDLFKKTEDEIIEYRGKDITMIFQDPLNSLNPVFKIGQQISEVYLQNMRDELYFEASKDPNKNIYSVAREWCESLLTKLNLPDATNLYERYPHELSGGMRQRVQIAMGLACSPKLLIADEPTTALDVTIQNQILQLMKDLLKEYDTAILFITHDLGIISKMCDRVAVMYSGYIVEYGSRKILFKTPSHPYTIGLLNSIPKVGEVNKDLPVIPGTVPNLIYPPSGCRFHPRCEFCFEPCDSIIPKYIEIEPNYQVACHLYDPKYKDSMEISRNKLKQSRYK
jgi:oligopeptide/dipeptide ABC transporter ATP-binding protein